MSNGEELFFPLAHEPMTHPGLLIVKQKATILSDAQTWMALHIRELIDTLGELDYAWEWHHDHTKVKGGEILFILGYQKIIPAEIRHCYKHALVVHASDLPQGRGWSPWVWDILAGKNVITVSLLAAIDKVDAGPIYAQQKVALEGHELLPEIRAKIGNAAVSLCWRFLRDQPSAKEQEGEPSYLPKRAPADSRLDLDKSIREQFNLLRTVDNERWPAYFTLNGHEYDLKITKRG